MDVNYRTLAASIIKAVNKNIKPDQRVLLKNIDYIDKEIRKQNKKSIRKIRKEFKDELFIISVFLTALSALVLWLADEKNNGAMIPERWGKKSEAPNPSLVFESLFSQTVNHVLAVIRLVKSGLDNPARVVLRSASELMVQTIVLLNHQDIYRKYISGNDFEDFYPIWQNIFSRGQLIKRLKKVEQKLGLPSDEDSMSEWIRDRYRFHSMAIHHSYIAVTVGSVSWGFQEDSDDVTGGAALFGSPSSSSRVTLTDLVFVSWFFLGMVFASFTKEHELDFDDGHPMKKFSYKMFKVFTGLVFHYRMQRSEGE